MSELEDLDRTDEDRPFVEQLFRDYGTGLTSYCSRLVGFHDAGDVLQQVFLGLIEKPENCEKLRGYEPGHREGWLHLTVYREALRQLKKRRRDEPTGETPESPEAKDPIDGWLAAKHAKTLLEQMRQALDEWDLTLLQVWLDAKEKGISYAQAATELDMEADALRQAVHRMVDPEKGRLREAILTVYLHDTQGGGCKDEKLRKAVSGDLNAQLRAKVARHVARCSDCQNTRKELPVLAGVHGVLPLLLPPPHVHEQVVHEVGYATSTPQSPATATPEAGVSATVLHQPQPVAAQSPPMRPEATRNHTTITRRVPTRRRRRALLLLLLLLLGAWTGAPTYAAHLYQSTVAPMTQNAAPANTPERIVPSNTPRPVAKIAPTSTTAPPLKTAPSHTAAPPIRSSTSTPVTAAPSTTTTATAPNPTLPTPTVSPPPTVSAPPKASPPSADSTAPSATIGLTKPAPAISKPLATATPCGLHVTAAVTNATSSAVNYLLSGAGPTSVVPMNGSPLAADLYPLDRPGPGEFTQNLQVTWWISATNGTKTVFTLGVTQTVAVCEHPTPVH